MCDFGRTESETGLVCESVLKNKETGDGGQNTGDRRYAVSSQFHLFHMLLLILNMLLFLAYETSRKELSRLTRLAEGA
jgi:hypothetical protein